MKSILQRDATQCSAELLLAGNGQEPGVAGPMG